MGHDHTSKQLTRAKVESGSSQLSGDHTTTHSGFQEVVATVGMKRDAEAAAVEGSPTKVTLVKRKRVDTNQLMTLEAAFQDDPLPSRRTKQKLAAHLGLSIKRVQIWCASRSSGSFVLSLFSAHFAHVPVNKVPKSTS